MMQSSSGGKQLVVCKLDNLWQYMRIVGDMTGLIVSAEFNALTSFLGIL